MDKALEADAIVDMLGKAMQKGETGLASVPGLLLRVINEDLWRDRVITKTGERATFDRFVDFVHTDPLQGLGADLPMLKRMCVDNPAALSAIDEVTRDAPGFNIVKPLGDNAPVGNASAYALRRLRKSAPTLHARVLTGELSPHAAMIEAGFRPKTITIPLDVPRIAAALVRHLTPEEIDRLVERLTDVHRP